MRSIYKNKKFIFSTVLVLVLLLSAAMVLSDHFRRQRLVRTASLLTAYSSTIIPEEEEMILLEIYRNDSAYKIRPTSSSAGFLDHQSRCALMSAAIANTIEVGGDYASGGMIKPVPALGKLVRAWADAGCAGYFD